MNQTARSRIPHAARAALALGLAALPCTVHAESDEGLAKKLSNPAAAVISVPLQYNVDFEIGPEDGTKHTLNIQPVIPHALNDDWNTRVITTHRRGDGASDHAENPDLRGAGR